MRQLHRRCAPLAVICTGLGFVAVAVAPAASADTASRYFGYSGGEQTFTVPPDVTSVHVVVVGGRGGNSVASGGSGALVTADLTVTGISTLYVEVGGNGQDAGSGGSTAGGFNGGGKGADFDGAGGGGASDVRTVPGTASHSGDSRLLVAGGGGGATEAGAGGASGTNGAPGDAGDLSTCVGLTDGGGGGGATQGGVGAGGVSEDGADFDDGHPGVGPSGGDGGAQLYGGGGGGGGLFGGGGGAGTIFACRSPGAGAGGGGGGSSYADPTLSPDASFGTDSSGTPSVTISYVVPQAPQAVTEPASAIGFNSVTLNGVVNPEGFPTTYQFEVRPAGTAVPFTLVGNQLPAGSDSTQVAEQFTYSGVSPGTGYDYQLIARNSIDSTPGGVQTFTTLGGPPDATTEPASGVGQTSATLNGVVNPEGTATNYWFEYGLSTSYGSTTAHGIPLSASGSAIPVAVSATGLAPGTTYHFRLVAENLSGTTSSEFDQTVTTLPAPAPTATTKAATLVGQHKATLNGVVNPRGAATTYHLEYGRTTGYGTSTPLLSAGSGTANLTVHALLSGLPRHTTYHFRLVAVSANGTTDGVDKTFRTT